MSLLVEVDVPRGRIGQLNSPVDGPIPPGSALGFSDRSPTGSDIRLAVKTVVELQHSAAWDRSLRFAVGFFRLHRLSDMGSVLSPKVRENR